MVFLQAFIGGIVGASLGACVAHVLSPSLGPMGTWLTLIAGLAGGLGTRFLCGQSRNFSTGIAAATSSILGIALVSYATAGLALQGKSKMEAPLSVATALQSSTVTAGNETPESNETSETNEPTDSEPPESLNETEVAPEDGASAVEDPPTEDRPADMGSSSKNLSQPASPATVPTSPPSIAASAYTGGGNIRSDQAPT